MSRTWDALRRAERVRPSQTPSPLTGRRAPDLGRDLDDEIRLQYERILVWMANHALQHAPIRSLMVVACESGSGATTTAVRLATTLAGRPSVRVLVVDANLRTPCLDLVFGLRSGGGVTDLLDGAATNGDHVRATSQPNLFVLPTGRIARFPGDTFSPAAVAGLVEQLTSRFDVTVFDVPPLLQFPDACALAPHVDAVLLVVESERTPIEDARRVVRDLERMGARVAGVVLNRQHEYLPRLLRRARATARRA